jgi:RimJ/RimL family protein N-acetyltransferase
VRRWDPIHDLQADSPRDPGPHRHAHAVRLRCWPASQPTIRGETVVLRPWREEDVEDVYRACQDPQIQLYTRLPVPYERLHAAAFISQSANRWTAQDGAAFAVTNLAGAVQGACTLFAVDHGARECSAGYWVGPWARRKGVGRNALRLATDWAFHDGRLDRVLLEIEEANRASVGVAVAAGFARSDEPPLLEVVHGSLRRMIVFDKSSAIGDDSRQPVPACPRCCPKQTFPPGLYRKEDV